MKAQCTITVDAGPDQTACAPAGQVTLQGSVTGDFLSFEWTPAAGLSDPTVLMPDVNVTGTATYTLTATGLDPTNLVTNPDFEGGNSGFSSDYVQNPMPISPGTYDVIASPVVPFFPPCDDHSPGVGNLMLVNGDGTPGDNIWCQTIAVTPNTDYVMSAWVASSPLFPPSLQFFVNGTGVGSVFQTSGAGCFWEQFTATWNSGGATSAQVCIVGQGSGNGQFGDDFALDDLFFGGTCTVTDQVQVSLAEVEAVLSPTAFLYCDQLPAGIVLDGSASSSGANISYFWSTFNGSIVSGENTNSVTVNAEGSYTLTVTFDNGSATCTDDATIDVLPDPNQVFANIAPPQEINCDFPTVTLDANGSSQGSTISYLWTTTDGNILFGETTPTPTVDQGGTYTLLVSNSITGCTAETLVTVDENLQAPLANATVVGTLGCNGSTVNLSGAGSSTGAGIFYNWTTPNGNIVGNANSQNAVANAAGLYILTVTNNNNGCTAADSVSVTNNVVPPIAQIQPPGQIGCSGASLQLSGSGSSAGANFSYLWTTTPPGNIASGATTLTPTVTTAGTYVLTVTNSQNQCTASASVNVTADSTPPVAQIEPPGQLGCTTTTLVLSGNGSSSGNGFTYLWTTTPPGNISSGATTLTPTVTATGTYVLTVTNTQNQCTASASVIVTGDTNLPVAVAGQNLMLDCVSTPIQLSGSGSSTGSDFTYLWTTTNGNILSGANTLTPTVNAPGTYVLTVTDTTNGCSVSANSVVTQDAAAPVATATSSGNLDCAASTVSINATGSSSGANISFVWTTTDGHFFSGQNTLIPVVDAPGTYLLTVSNTANSCSSSTTVTVTLDTLSPVADAGQDVTLNCNFPQRNLDGTASSTGSQFSYEWAILPPSGGQGGGNIVSGDTTLTPLVDEAGSYILTVTNEQNHCLATDAADVFEDFAPPIAEAGEMKQLNCNNPTVTLNGTASSTGVEFIYDWTFQPLPGGVGPAIVSGDSTLTPVVNENGFFHLVVTDTSNGCSAHDSVLVSLFANYPTVQIQPPPGQLTCAVTQLQLQANASQGGQYFYNWEFDSLGVAVGGGGLVSGSTTLTPTVNAPGAYVLTVTDNLSGCTSVDAVFVLENTTPPIANAGAPFSLSCASANATINGNSSSTGPGITYLWTTPNGFITAGATTKTPSISAPGTYYLNVFDANTGCSSKDTIVIGQDGNVPVANAGANMALTCIATTVTLNGSGSSQGTQYSYMWSTQNGHIVSGANTLNPVVDEPGTYLLMVTNTTNNCMTAATTQVVNFTQAPSTDAGTADTLTCLSPSQTLQGIAFGSGNITYLWTTPTGLILAGATTPTPIIGAAGTYVLTVTNSANGCTAQDSVLVPSNQVLPIVTPTAPEMLNCTTTQTNLSSAGSSTGFFYIYFWETANGNIVSGGSTPSPLVNAPGDYILTIANLQTGCSDVDTVTLTADTTLPMAMAGLDTLLTCNVPSLTLDGTASSQGSEFVYAWTTSPPPPQGGNIASGAATLTPVIDAPGTYVLLVTDTTNGCTATDQATVADFTTLPTVTIAAPGKLTCQTPNVMLNASGSSPGFHVWTHNDTFIVSGQNVFNIGTIHPGVYSFISTNQFGCMDSAEVIVVQDTMPPGADAGEPATINCQLTSLELTGSAGDPLANAAFSWTTPDGNIVSAQNTAEPVVDAAGTYFVTVTDLDNGCTSTDSVTIQAVTFDSFAFEIVQPTCPLPLGEIAFTSVSGGTPGYEYSIDGGANFSPNLVFPNLEPAVYELIVQDADGCELTATVEVLPPPAVEITFAEPVVTVNFGGQIQFDPQLNVAPNSLVDITWTPAEGLSCMDCLSPILTPNLSGDFTLFVQDVNGCSDSASLRVEVQRSLEFFVPNAFSPNGDGFNDVLVIFAQPGLAAEVLNFQIFNRWGGAVFQAKNFPPNDQSYGWDGSQDGKQCDVGVYVWFAEVELTDGERVILKGDVTLVR